MNPAFVVRLRPCGPWRIGPGSGARNRVDSIFHSDSLYSAVTAAMAQLGQLEDWLAATAANPAGSAVRFSSLFPFLEDMPYIPPPRNLWPPAPSARVRWRNASFVPLPLVSALAAESYQLNDRKWYVDGASGCLMPADGDFRQGPFRITMRTHAAVDRVSQCAVEVHAAAAIEFSENAGLWAVVSFDDEDAGSKWGGPLRAAFRLLADSGMGGQRSLGWGRSADPEFIDGVLPDLILPPVPEPVPAPLEPAAEGAEAAPPRPAPEHGFWLLSLFHPCPEDKVDWRRGQYSIAERGGRIESPARSGDLKKSVRMVEEGSVVAAQAPPRGDAPDVAPDGFPHPVYRFGCPISIPIPLRQVNA
jgi:CRISPR type III-A-associated RAMP protein Csm4